MQDGSWQHPWLITLPATVDNDTSASDTQTVSTYSCPPSMGAENGPEIVYEFTAPSDGKVSAIHFAAGEQVLEGAQLIAIE